MNATTASRSFRTCSLLTRIARKARDIRNSSLARSIAFWAVLRWLGPSTSTARRTAGRTRSITHALVAPSSLPTVDLMHPTQIAKPFHRAGWIYEEKLDGWRMVAIRGADRAGASDLARAGALETAPPAARRRYTSPDAHRHHADAPDLGGAAFSP